MIETDLSKQQGLIQKQYNKLISLQILIEQDKWQYILLLKNIEEAKETVLDFLHEAVKAL